MERRTFVKVMASASFAAAWLSNKVSAAPVSTTMAKTIESIRKGVSPKSLLLSSAPNAVFGEQRVPLIVLVATHGSLAQLKVLADADADPNAASSIGHTALKAALMRASVPQVDFLLQSGARVRVPGRHDELQAAIIGGSEDCIDLVLAEGLLPCATSIVTALRLRKHRLAESLWRSTTYPANTLKQIHGLATNNDDFAFTISRWHP
ncbi:ankyrin repeat protein [Xanthomonas arboricola]|uniref:hypothetical protein n=1 Tax=Xanthomonas euroxanthea TaxID=2259622 RepID=UPI00141ACBE3|nr:hypothetical protein [Xanthomonas euroxanthea]NIK07256.1 ankyrin repeat protein [Xanthomonas euroxanthea]